MLALLATSVIAWPYTVDDAYIVARYATRLAQGLGYGMNPGAPTDGVTGPLWLLPGVLAALLESTPIVLAKLVGVSAMLVACARVVLSAGRSALGARAAIACAAMLACLPDLSTWSVAGLETGVATLAATELALLLLGTTRPRPWLTALSALAAAAIPWLRPELVPFSLVVGAGLWRSRSRATRAFWLGAIAGAASVACFRVLMFGELLPLSASAKPAALEHGGPYVARAVLLSTSIIGCMLAAWGVRKGSRRRLWLLFAIAIHALAVAFAGGDWMPGGRLLVPVLPALALLAGRGVALLSLERPALAATALLLTLSLPLLDLATRMPELRRTGASRESSGRELAALLRAHTETVALLDVGYLGYASGVEIVDLGGLTDPHIGRAKGGHIDKRIDEEYLRSRAPDALIVHSRVPPRVDAEGRLQAFAGYPVEHRVLSMRLFEPMRALRVIAYAPDYYYVLLTLPVTDAAAR